MKIKKINDHCLKITMSIEELSEKNITIKDIEAGKKKAQDFFFDTIEQSAYADEFLKEDARLLVEVSITKDNKFSITITIIDVYENFSSFIPSKKKDITSYSPLYIFDSISPLKAFLNQVYLQNLYTGVNTLYKDNNNFYITFTRNTIRNINFSKTFDILTEYTNTHISNPFLICKLKENTTPLIERDAISTLCSYLFE